MWAHDNLIVGFTKRRNVCHMGSESARATAGAATGPVTFCALNLALFPLDKSGLLRHGAAMAEKQATGADKHKGKVSSPARQARLEKALRDNLKRRKDQARRQTERPGGTPPRA